MTQTYADTYDLKAWSRSDAPDDLIELALSTASEAVDLAAGRSFTGTIPAGIKMATLIQAARLLSRMDSPEGSPTRRQVDDVAVAWSGTSLDPDLEVCIAPHRTIWVYG